MPDYGFNLNLGPQTKPTTIGDMLGIAQGAQQLQQAQQINPLQVQEAQQRVQAGNITLGKSKQEEQERLALQQFMSDPNNWQTDGRVDINKLNSSIPKIAPLTGPKVINDLTTYGKAQTEATSALQNLTKEQRSLIAGPMGVLGRRGEENPEVYINELKHIKETHPNQKDLHKLIDIEINFLSKLKPGKQIAQSAIVGSQQLLSPEQQAARFEPTTGFTDVGGQLVQTISQPAVGGNLPSISVTGQGINKTLPPGTQVVAGENDPYGYAPGTKYFLPTNQPQQQTKPPVSNLAPPEAAKIESEAGAVKGAAEVGVKDWQQTYQDSKDANNTIASLQTIKKLVPDTFTGVGGERKKFLSGLAQAVGIPVYELETTKTDELMKNTKLLQLAGGNTDAARQIAELANPNVKMTKDAIHNVVNQLIGMNKMKIARADYLAPVANNPEEYNRKSQLFNKFADYRLFQELTPAEVKKIKLSMTPAEREEMKRKIQEARMAGIIK